MFETDGRSDVLEQIGDGVVRIFEECTGRSPTPIGVDRSERLLTVLLRDVLTSSERGLSKTDGGNGVRLLRWEEQEAMRPKLVSLVEAELGREVMAFLSANHVEPDLAVETFVLDIPSA